MLPPQRACVRDLVVSGEKSLRDVSDTPRLDAELILSEVLNKERVWLFTWPEHQLEIGQIAKFESLLAQRAEGKPVAHILGRREFWGLELDCNAHTLIPRPETELLVEMALSLNLPSSAAVLDLGTGTGAIALALKSERPHWQISAVDFVPEAIALARANADKLDISPIKWYLGSWFEPLPENSRFDLVVSNPPYVESDSPWLQKGDVRFEPLSALISGLDGMADIELIAQKAVGHLNPEGWLLVEHGYQQGDRVRHCLQRNGYRQIDLLRDLAGLDRATLARVPGQS